MHAHKQGAPPDQQQAWRRLTAIDIIMHEHNKEWTRHYMTQAKHKNLAARCAGLGGQKLEGAGLGTEVG